MLTYLVNLPWIENGRLGVRAGSRWPFTSIPEIDGKIHYIPFPFFLAYSAALLKQREKQAVLFDAIAEGIDKRQFLDKVKTANPNLIVVETSAPSFANDIRIVKNIRMVLPFCKVALCGPHASVFPKQILEEYNFVDYILVGEYEFIVLDLVNSLETNLDLKYIPGLVYRRGSQIVVNKQRQVINNLDELPWPERNTDSIYKYNDGFCGLPKPNIQMWASRGCPFNCSFCLWPQTIYGGRRYRKRNPVYVVDEMEFLIRNFDFKAVYFDDDVFNIDKKHVLAICTEIKKRGIKIPWAIMARVDLMDEEILNNLYGAGLYAVKYGIESADERVLDFCNKGLDLRKSIEIIKLTKSLGIKVHLTFCLGLPGETKETIEKMKEFIHDNKPDTFQVSLATPFPGTRYFRYSKGKGYLSSQDWRDYDGNYKCVIKTKDLTSRDLEKALADFDAIGL